MRMGRDNKRHPNGTVLIEPRSSAKPISEAPVPLLAAVIPVVLAPAAPPVVLLATWDITVPLLLAEPLNALALGASEAVCSVCLAAALTAISLVVLLATLHSSKKIRWILLAELFLADALLARLALGIVCLAAIVIWRCCVLLATWCTQKILWVLPAELFLAYALGAREALGIVCLAANWWSRL